MDITYKDLQGPTSEELPTFFVVFFFGMCLKMFFSMFYHSKPPSNQHLVDIFVPSILSKSLVFLRGKGGGGRACQKFMKNVKFPETKCHEAMPCLQFRLLSGHMCPAITNTIF